MVDEQDHGENLKGQTGRAKLGTGRTNRESCSYMPKGQGVSKAKGHLWALHNEQRRRDISAGRGRKGGLSKKMYI